MPVNIDPLWIWIAVGALALLIVAALIARGSRKARTHHLREKYGTEYEHVVAEKGKRRIAEQELLAREKEVRNYDLRPLTLSERDRFRREWVAIERRFLERPTTAVVEADELVADMMRVRGYPMGDFEKHAAHLSVTHPRVVEHYRAGHRAIASEADRTPSTEDLRQAMLHYRALFEELIAEVKDDVVGGAVPSASDADFTSPRRPEPRPARDGDRPDIGR